MTSSRRQALGRIAAGAAGAVVAPFVARIDPALASWPDERAIKIVVPFAPGGPTDLIGRTVAQAITDAFRARVYVENRPGAGGNVAFVQVARAPADGYTLLVCSNALLVNPSLYDSIDYDPLTDFQPISEMLTAPNVFFASPKSGLGSIAGLVAAARRHPDALNYASPGIGTTPQLAAELLKVREGIRVANVVFGGSAPASQAVLAGDVEAGCVALPGAHVHIRAGTLVGLALTGEHRWHDLPDVPTMRELGYDDFVLETVYFLAAPVGVPSEIVSALVPVIARALRTPQTSTRFEALGFEVLARGPASLSARIAREVPMWRDIVAKTGILARSRAARKAGRRE